MDPVVGIDVAKRTLDAHSLPSNQRRQVANAPDGWAELAQWLTSLQPKRVVLEATGGYEAALAAELHAAGLPVVVLTIAH